MYKDNEQKNSEETSVFNEKNMIKKMLFCVLFIIPGILMLYFKDQGLNIPGLLITITGFISFLLVILSNISRINSYQEQMIFDEDYKK